MNASEPHEPTTPNADWSEHFPHAGAPANVAPPLVPTAPGRRSRRPIVLIAIAAVLLALLSGGVGYAIGAGASDTDSSRRAAPTTSETTTQTWTAPTPVTAADFSLDVLVEEQKCFGSAGCLVTISLTPTFLGSSTTLSGRSFKVLYRILGGEDPILGKFTIIGSQVTIDSSTSVSTPSSDTEITATVTNVIETTDQG